MKIQSINDVTTANNNLNNQFTDVAALTDQSYPSGLTSFQNSVEALTAAQNKYDTIMQGTSGNVDIGTTQITVYPIETLYITLGNYAEKYSVGLTFDLVNGTASGLYNLNFKLYGNYSDIADFVSAIENDSNLNFQIDNFAISPGGGSMDSSANTGSTDSTNSASSNVGTNTNTASTNTTAGRTNTNTASSNTNTQNSTAAGTDTVNLNATFTVTDIGVTLDE